MQIDDSLRPGDLKSMVDQVFSIAARKTQTLDRAWDPADGTPVFTVDGKYASRGWTEWTQGFQYGCILLAYDATDDDKLLSLGRDRTIDRMLPHVTHVGVHDHGFNNLSTYGNLLRLMNEGRIEENRWERETYSTAIRCSGAVQAARWADVAEPEPGIDGGYICSFNGPHSLFIDTMRTIRILSAGHRLGHVLMGENDQRISLLGRMITHALTSARWLVWYGEDRDAYDVKGRTAHEGIFNRHDGQYRCPNSQQGYSPFTTWTRGLAWAMLGYAEELEYLETIDSDDFRLETQRIPTRTRTIRMFEKAAKATCDHYIERCSTTDGVCYWDDGAPGLANMPDWRDQPGDPYNEHEPIDSSASAIAAQGLIRLGMYLGDTKSGSKYLQAGLTTARTLFDEPYLSTKARHQGLLLHSVYHRPNGWDHVPQGRSVPCDESSMWGDYHLLELALLVKRLADKGTYPTFFNV